MKGVLLVNLGSPDAPTREAIRRFLREFLGDPEVVDLPRILWWPILNLAVLPIRSRKNVELYQRIWTSEGSPLIAISARQRDRLEEELGDGYAVEMGMRYGNPSIESGVRALVERGATSVTMISMFPQYSRTTTGSVEGELERVLARIENPPPVRQISSYPDDEGYVDALADRVRETIRTGGEVDHYVISFHGLPKRLVEVEGDPYLDHCRRTVSALAAKLELDESDWTMTFQSRFGREAWLDPYTDVTIAALAPEHPRVLVTCPAFVADCLETLDEIQILLRETFLAAGGRQLLVAPCVNDSAVWIRAMARLVRAEDA